VNDSMFFNFFSVHMFFIDDITMRYISGCGQEINDDVDCASDVTIFKVR